MAIKVTTTNSQKPDVKPFPKLMNVNEGPNVGTIILFTEKNDGVIILGKGEWEAFSGNYETDWDMDIFTDYNQPLTFCGFVSVILACRHLPLKINFIAKIIAQNHC